MLPLLYSIKPIVRSVMSLAIKKDKPHAFTQHPPALASGESAYILPADTPAASQPPSRAPRGKMIEAVKKEVSILTAAESMFLNSQDVLQSIIRDEDDVCYRLKIAIDLPFDQCFNKPFPEHLYRYDFAKRRPKSQLPF